MSAIALDAGRDGPRRVGQRPPRAAGARPAAGRRRHRPRRPRPRPRRRRRRRHRLHRHPGDEPRAGGGPPRPGSRCCGGPACWRRSARRPTRVAVAGTHGKTTTTSMLAMILAEAGLAAQLPRRRRRQRRGHRRPLVRRARGSWSRPTRATAPTSSCPLDRHHPHQRRGRPPRPLRHASTPSSTPSTATWPAGRRAEGAVRRRSGHCPTWPRRHDAITYGTDAEALATRPGRRRRRRGVAALRRRPRRRRAGRGRAAAARAAQRAQRLGRHRHGRHCSACRSTLPSQALARFGGVARRFDVRGRHDGITLVDDYAHLPTEIAAVLEAAGRQRRRLDADRGRVPAQPLQPHGRAVAGVPRTPSSAPTSPSSPTSTRRARRRCPGVTGQAGRRRRVRRPP